MNRDGTGMHSVSFQGQRTRPSAAAAALLFLAEALLPLVLVFSASAPAGASLVTTADDGRSQFLVPVEGVPYRFNISVPAGSVVTSFSITLATAPGQLPPLVPADVSLDLGLDGPDWRFGGGAEGAVGFQQTLDDGSATGRRTVGASTGNFSFLLPRSARIEALDFRLVPYVNMTLWNASEFVTVVQGAAAVPLNVSGSSAPEIGDLDGDGTVDLVTSGDDGALHAYARVGTTGQLFNETPTAFSPTMPLGRTLLEPLLRDVDRDGDLDLVVGTGAGNVLLFQRQDLSQTAPYDFFENTSYFAGISVPLDAAPTMGDLDGDGDLDLVIGAADGSFIHYRNEIGEGTGLNWRALNTFGDANLTVAAPGSPCLVDLDGDGDLDVVAGDAGGAVTLIENVGNATAPSFVRRPAFAGLGTTLRASPALVDWSQDGRPDIFYGARSGLIYYTSSLGGLPADLNVTLPGTEAGYPIAAGQVAAPVEVSVPDAWLAPVANVTLPLRADAQGNELKTVTLRIGSTHFGEVALEDLRLRYAATLPVPDMAAAFRGYAAAVPPVGNRTVVPVSISGAPSVPATSPSVEVHAIAVRIDDAPAFLPFPRLSLGEDTAAAQLVDLRTYLSDEDGANATFEVVIWTNSTYVAAAVSAGHFLSLDAATGDLNNNWTGETDIVVRAVDSFGQASVSPAIRVGVTPVEDAPVIEFIASRTMGPNDVLDILVRAIDGDPGDSLGFSLLPPSPSSMSIDAATGVLRWSPSSAERTGSAHVVVAVTDGVLADTQAFDVYFVPAPVPVFGKPLQPLVLLPGRPEFLNLFDFATGNLSSVHSVTLQGPAHPFVNLSWGGEWVAFDYPADYPAGSDRVTAVVGTDNGNESVSIDLTILPNPTGLFIAPFPPTPLSRGLVHRIELLRYARGIVDVQNLSFEVAHTLASVTGYNLTLVIPADYPGPALSIPVTMHAGDKVVTASWTVFVDARSPVPRVGRLPIVSAGARDIDLGYALSTFGIGTARWPLTTTSPHLTVTGVSSFRISYPAWPADVAARDAWPIERARVRDSAGKDLLEVELGYDGRSRYVDRVQYLTEDEEVVIDGSFALRPELAGALVRDLSLVASGPASVQPLESIVRLDGSLGVGWRLMYTRDTRLGQLTMVGITDPSGTMGETVAWSMWAVVTARDDAPTYLGGLADITVTRGLTKTVDLSAFFADEEGDDLLFALSASSAGVTLDRATGWLTLDGRTEFDLTDVHVIAMESKNQSLAASSGSIAIRAEVQAGTEPSGQPTTADPLGSPLVMGLLLLGAVAAAGAAAFAVLSRREENAEDRADDDVDATVTALGGGKGWDAVEAARPEPTVPPAPDDPQMLALEEEWSRVIASRSTDATSAPGDTEGDIDPAQRRRAPARPPAPEEAPERPAKMTSSDTESERRAGETDSAVEVTRKRRRP